MVIMTPGGALCKQNESPIVLALFSTGKLLICKVSNLKQHKKPWKVGQGHAVMQASTTLLCSMFQINIISIIHAIYIYKTDRAN